MRLAFLLLLFPLTTTVLASPRVVTTIQPLHSLTSALMQDIGKPELLIPSTTSPHHFSLRPSQRRLLDQADLMIWVGPALEGFIPRIIPSLPEQVHTLSLMPVKQAHHEHEDEDPHLWLSPAKAITISKRIREALIRSDPENAKHYRQNAQKLISRLQQLDASLAKQLHPVRNTPFIVFHDAYSYLVSHYDLNQVGSVTLSEHQAAGARHLQSLRRQLVEQDIPCLFTEPQFEPAIVENLIKDTNTRTISLDPIGSHLDPGPDAYFQMMKALGDNLSQCLSGQ